MPPLPKLNNPLCHAASKGFTLIEIMVALGVLVTLVSMAMPALQSLVTNQRAKTGANDLMTSLIYTRSEAIKRNRDVFVVANLDSTSKPDWSEGWIVTTDGDDTYAVCTGTTPPGSCLRVQAPLTKKISVHVSELTDRSDTVVMDQVRYSRDGRFSFSLQGDTAFIVPAELLTLTFCSSGALERVVSFKLIGTPHTDVESNTCL